MSRSSVIRELLAGLSEAQAGPLIGVIDGAPDLASPDLSEVSLSIEPVMLLDEPAEPDPHGTEVCALILGRRFGLAPDLRALALPVFFRRTSEGRVPSASQMDLARALTIAAERGAEIVNVSAGQRASSPEAARHLADAVALCAEKRILIVASAGNDGCPCIHIPAAMPTVLAVGAMTETGEPLEPSNWGAAYAENGLLAPGHDLATTSVGGAAVRRSGTSFAAAVVSAAAAKLLAAARAKGLPLDARDVGDLLLETATPCDLRSDSDCRRVLAGRLDLPAALQRLDRLGAGGIRPPPKPRTPAFATIEDRGMAMDGLAVSGGAGVTASALEDAGTRALTAQGCACGGGAGANGADRGRDEAVEAGTKPAARQSVAALSQQGCGCQSNQPPQLVYAIGALWFDFGTEARYDAIVQQMGDPVAANDPVRLIGFLSENIAFASGVTFVLMQDQIPIYAIAPSGPFAVDVYRAMLDAMGTSLDAAGDLQRVAVPGFMSGTTRLMNGMTLPILHPDIRGMTKWRAGELATAARAAVGEDGIPEESIFNFLVRVYDELRNLGVSPQERAMNFAATNAYQSAVAFGDGARRELELYRITVRKSPICRPESDCWDVQLVMFDAENERRAARVYRYTVDVSEVLPVTVGVMRSWSAPLAVAIST